MQELTIWKITIAIVVLVFVGIFGFATWNENKLTSCLRCDANPKPVIFTPVVIELPCDCGECFSTADPCEVCKNLKTDNGRNER